MSLQAIKQQRADAVREMRSLVAAAEKEGRDLKDDETARFDELRTESETLEQRIDRLETLKAQERRVMGEPVSGKAEADFDKMAGNVSIREIIAAQVEGRALEGREAEYTQEAERRTGRKAQGVFVPMQALEKRANTTTSASEIVGTDHRPQDYVGALRDNLLARRLGARVLTGLRGDVTIPKHGSSMSTGWVAEGDALSESDMTFDNVTLSPKHAGGMTEMSRQLIMQSSPDVEQLIRDDMGFLLAQAIDSAMINGGGANEPTGILAATGTQSHSLATLDYDAILQMMRLAEEANVSPNAFLTNPQVKAILAGTEKSSGTGEYLYQDGRMVETGLRATNGVPNLTGTPDTGRMILGDFRQVMLGIWSEIDLLVNPYEATAYARGGVKIRAMSTVDVALRHPDAFVIADDIAL